jgi:hypothetical protein
MSRERNKKLVRLGAHLVKERHDEIVEHNKIHNSGQDSYPNDYDEFVKGMVANIGQFDYFGHQLPTIIKDSSLSESFKEIDIIRAVVEYLLYYSGSDKQIDVVNTIDLNGLGDYLDKVRPKLPEHLLKYLWGLQSLYDDRGSQNMVINKQYLWDYYIKDKVEERMLDPDWVSENSDDIDTEERLFKTYWHYPMTSLDWGIDSIYDHYDDFIDWYSDDLITYLFPNSEYHTKSWDRLRLTFSFDALFINRYEFIDNPEGK